MMDKNKAIESASKLIARGSFDKAVKEYQRVLDVDPDDVRVLQKLAELYQKMQRREEAADCFEKVARTYAAQGFYLKAVALYKQVLKAVDRIEVNVRLAELYQQLGLIGDATKEWQHVAAWHEKVGDLKASLDTLRKLVDLDPDNVAARIRLGEQYARQDQTVEAVTELRRAASYLQRNGRQDDYLRVAERISHLDQGDVALARELADSYLARGDSKRALAKLQICFKANPRDLGTLSMLARAFRELGQVSKTVSVLKELARVHLDSNQADEAQKVYDQAIALAPDDAELKASVRGLEEAKAAVPVPQLAEPPPKPFVAGTARWQRPPTAPIPQRPPTAPVATAPNRPATGPIAQTRSTPGSFAVPRPPTGPVSVPPRPEATPIAAASVPKLLKETEVYVKYGLHEKALEHLSKIFSVEPSNAEAHEKAKALAMAMNRPADAAASLSMLVKLYAARSDPRAESAKAELRAIDPGSPALQLGASHGPPTGAEAAGEEDTETVEVEGGAPAPAPGVEAESRAPAASASAVRDDNDDNDEPVVLGEYLDGDLDESSIVEDPEVVFADGEDARFQTEPVALDARKAQAPAQPEEDAFSADLAEADFYIQAGLGEDARAILEAILLAEPDHAGANSRLVELSAPIDPQPRATGQGAQRFVPHQGDLVDELAAELASEVASLGAQAEEGAGPLEPDSLESFQVPVQEVLGEFRAKIAATVRPEDVQTHYDLGIAYKEMGLINEATAEFEVALRHGGGVRQADCVTMLGVCALEKGQAGKAIEWFRAGLDEPQLDPAARRALAFELASAYETIGQTALALEQYQLVERVEPGFRDVAARITRLGGTFSGPKRMSAPPARSFPPLPASKQLAAPAPPEPASEVAPAPVETLAQRRNRKIGFV